MEGLRIILLGIFVLILIANLIINSGNLFKIITYCYHTNSILKYWSLFFKTSYSARAIFSSIIGIFCLVVAPFILTYVGIGLWFDISGTIDKNIGQIETGSYD